MVASTFAFNIWPRWRDPRSRPDRFRTPRPRDHRPMCLRGRQGLRGIGCSALRNWVAHCCPGEGLGVGATVGRIAVDRREAGGAQVLVQRTDFRRGDDVERAGHGIARDRNPEASASTITRPNVSVRLGKTKQWPGRSAPTVPRCRPSRRSAHPCSGAAVPSAAGRLPPPTWCPAGRGRGRP